MAGTVGYVNSGVLRVKFGRACQAYTVERQREWGEARSEPSVGVGVSCGVGLRHSDGQKVVPVTDTGLPGGEGGLGRAQGPRSRLSLLILTW